MIDKAIFKVLNSYSVLTLLLLVNFETQIQHSALPFCPVLVGLQVAYLQATSFWLSQISTRLLSLMAFKYVCTIFTWK